ncbi:NAD(+) synthase [Echinicola strongylocentroti]|uniref:Glutamine-dependent NAD(+) synthetase n=1 Tax=Echinicola strongylocentroti TaxID=1795355 RepID=A0A2Z4IKT2_9BACT|nr:NAD(+) synthase [Echinicola strongylocentroti]AWW31722.1 NAD(+) synthase [Echinicola strongylocentroti]
MSILKIGGATVNQTPLDWEGNLKNITDAITEAKSKGIELLCFPELAITGYGSEDLFLSRWYPEKAFGQLKKLLPLTKDITVCIGVPVRIGELLFNCTAVLEDNKVLGFMAKQFLAIDGVHYEFRWFTPWKAGKITSLDFYGTSVPFGDIVFNKKGVTYGFEICEDAWRGDLRPGYRLKDRNVDLIFNPSASHFAMRKSAHREELVIESSASLDAAYFYVNLLGNEAGRMIFDGEVLFAQNGKLLVKNKLLSYKPYQVYDWDFTKSPAPSPAIDSSHNQNEEFTAAVCLALFDYMRKSRSTGFVLSLSGGADSSSIATLVAEMVKRGVRELGLDNFLKRAHLTISLDENTTIKSIVKHVLTTAYQGSENSSEDTLASARCLAESLGATFYDWKISEEVSSYTQKIETAIDRKLTWSQDDITLQNIQARVRAPVIWMLANLNNALLLATSNRSEGDVGYATMDGDTSGSISPIAAVDKDFILQWLRWAEEELGYEGLRRVNSLQPTAELRPQEQHQTDEQDLMPYPVIVEIERLAIRDRRKPADIYLILKQELDISPVQLKNYIHKFFRLWSRNQWKRERLAPSFHLDDFNVDPKTWCRFPILSGGFTEELHELDQIDE